MHACGISADLLEIEITESVLQSEDSCISTLDQLQDLGIVIAIDDFGTGYSCLSSLKLLPINKLKIDKAFIQGLPTDKNDVAITESIIAIAKTLDMRVIAEGVETAAQLAFLKQHHCDEVQGFYYFTPLPASDIRTLLTRQALNDPH